MLQINLPQPKQQKTLAAQLQSYKLIPIISSGLEKLMIVSHPKFIWHCMKQADKNVLGEYKGSKEKNSNESTTLPVMPLLLAKAMVKKSRL